MVDTNRRRFLQGVGAGGSVGLAGCAQLGSSDSNGSTDDTSTSVGQDAEDGEIPADGVAVSLTVDRQQLQQKQQQLRLQVRSEQITQEEAAQQLQELQSELAGESASSFEEEADEIEITTRVLEQGALVVSGPSDALVATLQYDSVRGLISTNPLRRAQQQSGSN